MRRTHASPWRRAWLGALALFAAFAPNCDNTESAPSSEVSALRILAVTVDPPYAVKDTTTNTFKDPVSLKMTFVDGAGSARPIQIAWIGGCTNPAGNNYAGCYAQKLEPLPGNLAIAPAELSGLPDAVSSELVIPEDILDGVQPVAGGSVVASAYVFFAACAGAIRPVATPKSDALPIECVAEGGEVLGADSFVVGYTQIYVFEDGRTNSNPSTTGMSLDGAAIADGAAAAPPVARCATAGTESAEAGCGKKEETDCTTYEIAALIGDVAELDPESSTPDGAPLKEPIWVNYFATAGDFDSGSKLVSDATTGYRQDHAAKWTPPAEPGLVTLWAVAHDARGGASVVRRFVVVQ